MNRFQRMASLCLGPGLSAAIALFVIVRVANGLSGGRALVLIVFGIVAIMLVTSLQNRQDNLPRRCWERWFY